ncbi:MAG TPA: hypothetical protein VFT98_13260 [Myxococcota bacterium]|nr:hypothetical protein [Myxococcota bacterium]
MGSAARKHLPPVKWLLGSQLLSRARQIAMSAVYGDKIDPTDWMTAHCIDLSGASQPSEPSKPDASEFWFDYLSDTGDATAATYSVAYLALSDLRVTSEQPPIGACVSFDEGRFVLRRGAFLLVGGDTAYHVADVPTLGERFLKPFEWAFEDVAKRTGAEPDPRLILGVPGNHDYYDALDGFNRVFRKPTGDSEPVYNHIHGFYRAQESTYAAVKLPFDWWLFALDAQRGKIDGRQRAFFKQLIDEHEPTRLVLATPEPSTVFGRTAPADAEIAKTLASLELSQPFHEGGRALERCRLDLAGDVHHYARYWGPAARNGAQASPHYASVVAGLGGAFLHPSHTDFGDIAPQAVYPDHATSRELVARRTLNPWWVHRGGGVGVIGAVIALIVYFAASVPETTQMGLPPNGETLTWLRDHVFDLGGRPAPDVFHDSLWFFVFALLAVGSVALAVWLRDEGSKTLRKRGAESAETEPTQKLPVGRRTLRKIGMWGAWIVAILAPYFALWKFGTHSAALLTSDVIFIAAIAACVVGLSAAGAFVGGARHALIGKLGLGLVGLLHGVFQLGVPYMVVSRALSTTGFAIVALIGAQIAMVLLARRGWRWPLLTLFALHGLAQIGVPWRWGVEQPATIPRFAAAFLTGAVSSCVFFGEYLAVALAFNGHNNEAGGAARIEQFKLFVRCRLFREQPDQPAKLGVYVIGVDEPKQNGAELKPKVIDYFELA